MESRLQPPPPFLLVLDARIPCCKLLPGAVPSLGPDHFPAFQFSSTEGSETPMQERTVWGMALLLLHARRILSDIR